MVGWDVDDIEAYTPGEDDEPDWSDEPWVSSRSPANACISGSRPRSHEPEKTRRGGRVP